MTTESATNLLTAAYTAEVNQRGRQLVHDAPTASHISTLATVLTSERPRIGFVLCGQCGNGKTTLLYALNSALLLLRSQPNLRKLATRNEDLWIVDAKELAATARNNETLFRQMCDAPLLAIEDLGKEAAEVTHYGNTLSPVADVIERRYDKQLFTAITTNLTATMLNEKYGERVADRFREMLTIIPFKNPSYR